MATGVSIGGGSGDASGDLYKLWSGGDPQGMYDYAQDNGLTNAAVDQMMIDSGVQGWTPGLSQTWVDENVQPPSSVAGGDFGSPGAAAFGGGGYLPQAQPTTPPVTALPPGAIPLTDQPAGISVGGGGDFGSPSSMAFAGPGNDSSGFLPTTPPTPQPQPTSATGDHTGALYNLWSAKDPYGMHQYAKDNGLSNDAVDQIMIDSGVQNWTPGLSQSWENENIGSGGVTGGHAQALFNLWSAKDPYGMLKYAQDNGLTNAAVDQMMIDSGVQGWTAGLAQSWVTQNIDPNKPPPTMEATLSDINRPTDTVAGQLESLLGADSPYIDRARLRAMEYANSRGLLNSSMAAGAGEAAAIDAALPIAQSDASAYLSQRLANQTAGQEAGVTNVNIAASQRIQALKNAGAESVSRIQAETTLTAGREKIASAEGISEAGLISAEKIQSMRDANSIVLAKFNNDVTVELADLEAQMRLLGIRGDLGQQYLASSSALIQNHAMRETSIQNSQGLDDDAKVFALGVNDQLTKDMFSANDSFWVTVNSSMDWTQLSG